MKSILAAALACVTLQASAQVYKCQGTEGTVYSAAPCAPGAAGLSKTAAARLLHSTYRVWLQWESGDRQMHPAFWELFLLKTSQPEPPASTPE